MSEKSPKAGSIKFDLLSNLVRVTMIGLAIYLVATHEPRQFDKEAVETTAVGEVVVGPPAD